MNAQKRRDDNSMAEMFLSLAMTMVHDNITAPVPIALVRKGGNIQALTTKALKTGELMIPFVFQEAELLGHSGRRRDHPSEGSVRKGILDSGANR